MKQKFKNVFELYKLDWRRIYDNKLTFLLIIALMIIPSLYAWFNIAALWDPYSNTKDIAIAVYSDDETAEVLGQTVNIGDKIIDGLKDNDKVGWQFVKSKSELDKGVQSGKYYGGIYLPKDFSENLVSFVSGDIQKPKIEYSVNQKINAIAPKITDKGAAGIKDTISTEFVATVSDTLLKVFNDIGYDLDSNLVTINKISSKILTLDDNLDNIDGYAQKVVQLNQDFPEYKKKIDKAHEVMDYIPEVDKLGGKIVELNDKMPEIKKQGKIVYDLQDKIPEIQDAGRQIAMVDEDFEQVEEGMNKAITEAKNSLVIIDNLIKIMPKVAQLTKDSNQLLQDLNKQAENWPTEFDEIANTVQTTGTLIINTLDSVIKELEDLQDIKIIEQNKDEIANVLSSIANVLSKQAKLIDTNANILEALSHIINTDKFDAKIQDLRNKSNRLKSIATDLTNTANGIRDGSITDPDFTPYINAIKDVRNTVEKIISPELISTLKKDLQAVINIINEGQSITGEIIDENIIDNISSLLSNTKVLVEETIPVLEKYQKELPAIKKEIHDANLMLNGNMDKIVNGINKAVAMYENDLPEAEKKLALAANFVKNDWPGVKKDLNKTMKLVDEKVPEVEKALASATTLIQNDWPNIKSGIHKAAGFIREGQKDVDLAELIKLLKSDAQSESDFIANPVMINQHDVYPVPNNGSASAPFYTALCLWVGAVLFSSIATTDFHLSKDDQKRYSKRQQFLARMLTFQTVAFFQALIVACGNLWLLGTYAFNPVYNVLFALFIAFVFMMMVYVLVALLGNLGKGAAVIILVLSISGGGGNYPIEMSGKFFQFIHPFLPFTHAVNLLRESVGGIYWPNTIKAMVILLIFGIAFFLLGVLFFPEVRGFTKKLNEKLQEGHILH
ncbi:YhgE/Pip domain-containing protein [Vagococcus lutrae]|uniref:ABC-2 type transporter transmembrane domain-containing protein n=1 Tax=Vagococcus lutrae LBD1 TaxID=1408226 RepID=V6Q2Z2_9ENTE|nr:YhgE/Pip domain-containing protein [Vagococcus lutrae]EST89494.1 hypothetical protein T233_01249 [Vagococcus lutrae LBD1]MDT2806887.1 YhgE/Pip domain-containing protein [Vagococcus lutrae]MDT2824662.1 YhgE/Pip domain-containing protein [Vagococcus lutrae]RST91634.1 phage infection protein [Vagococcus lutrae]UQF18707.1 YhgE/Pip domain-containing protein [Vagococcus lutrae]